MKEFLLTEILVENDETKQNLITLNPKLPYFFTDIFIPTSEVNTTIPFLPICCFEILIFILDIILLVILHFIQVEVQIIFKAKHILMQNVWNYMLKIHAKLLPIFDFS